MLLSVPQTLVPYVPLTQIEKFAIPRSTHFKGGTSGSGPDFVTDLNNPIKQKKIDFYTDLGSVPTINGGKQSRPGLGLKEEAEQKRVEAALFNALVSTRCLLRGLRKEVIYGMIEVVS